MPRKSRAVCLGLSVLIAWPAAAEPVDDPIQTVAGLRAACTQESDDQADAETDEEPGTCVGYIKGVADTARAVADATGHDLGMCIDEEVGEDQLVDAVVEALDGWSGADDDNPAPAVLAGLLKAFPCGAEPLTTG